MTEPTVPMHYPEWEPPQHEEEAPRRAPRRRRRGRKWLIALGVLIALLVAADRIGLLIAENQLASRIQTSQHLSQKPDVSIDGFPFLTQVAARDFGHATVDIHGLDANGIPISDLHADLRGVHVNGAFNGANVDTIVATAELNYTDIAAALENSISIGGTAVGTLTLSPVGTSQLKATFSVLGVSASATIAVTIAGPNEIEFKSAGFDTPLGDLGTPASFSKTIQLAIPFGITLNQLEFTQTAVQISATGHNVNLSQSSVSSAG